MYDENGSLNETASFLSAYPPEQIVRVTYVMCENLFHRTINNASALGGSDGTHDLTPEEASELDASLTPDKRRKLASRILVDVLKIRKILYAAGLAVNQQEANKNQNSEG